jgi:hypothetical protein
VNAASVLSGPPGADAELRHGYTLAEVSRLSTQAVRGQQHWHQAMDFDNRVELAWHAIIEHIYSATQPPSERDVICGRADLHHQQVGGALRLRFTQKTYVHASDDDLKQGRQALAQIHKIAWQL